MVFGVLYDARERTFPFRWESGVTIVLRGPDGKVRAAQLPERNAINARGEAAAAALQANPVVIAQLDDIDNRRMIVGNAFGLAKRDYGALRRIDPVVWTCEFSH